MKKIAKEIESINAATTKKEVAKVVKFVNNATTYANREVREYGKTISGCVSSVLAAYQQPNETMFYTDLKYIVSGFCEVTGTKPTKSKIMKNHAAMLSVWIDYQKPVTKTRKNGETYTILTPCTTAKVLKYMKTVLIEALEAKFEEAKAISGELAEKVASEIETAKNAVVTETAE